MNTYRLLTIIFTATLTFLLFLGCSSRDVPSAYAQSTADNSESHEVDEGSRDAGESDGNIVHLLVTDFMSKLGYEPSHYSITSEEIVPYEENAWAIQLDDSLGPWANLVVNEELELVEMFMAVQRPPEMASAATMPGEDLFHRVADALGFYSIGYEPFGPDDLQDQADFRKYTSFEEWSICTGQITIRTHHGENSLYLIHRRESQLPENIAINVNLDAAIEKAAAFHNMEEPPEPFAELIHMQDADSPSGFSIFWEIIFEGYATVYIRSGDGTIMGYPDM